MNKWKEIDFIRTAMLVCLLCVQKTITNVIHYCSQTLSRAAAVISFRNSLSSGLLWSIWPQALSLKIKKTSSSNPYSLVKYLQYFVFFKYYIL